MSEHDPQMPMLPPDQAPYPAPEGGLEHRLLARAVPIAEFVEKWLGRLFERSPEEMHDGE